MVICPLRMQRSSVMRGCKFGKHETKMAEHKKASRTFPPYRRELCQRAHTPATPHHMFSHHMFSFLSHVFGNFFLCSLHLLDLSHRQCKINFQLDHTEVSIRPAQESFQEKNREESPGFKPTHGGSSCFMHRERSQHDGPTTALRAISCLRRAPALRRIPGSHDKHVV